MDQWYSDVTILRRNMRRSEPRTYGGLGLISPEHTCDLAKLNQLLLVAVFDEPIGRRRPAIRVIAYRPCLTLNGVDWASADNSVLYKDLSLTPEDGRRGLVFDLKKPELLQLSLKLNSRISQAETRLRLRSRQDSAIQLPRLWAGFSKDTYEAIGINGPECEQIAGRFHFSLEKLKLKFTRHYHGLELLPLDWVSDHLMSSLQIYADLAEFPRTQVFSLAELPGNLQGYMGASRYDFFSSRFRAENEARLHQDHSAEAASQSLRILAY